MGHFLGPRPTLVPLTLPLREGEIRKFLEPRKRAEVLFCFSEFGRELVYLS